MEEKELLTADAAAAKLYVTKRTILRWAREGKIKCRRISRKVVLFSQEAIDSLGQIGTNEVKLEAINHQGAGRKITSPQTKKGGGKKTSGELSGDLRKEVLSWL
jgi:excisionase family DNA binding protein